MAFGSSPAGAPAPDWDRAASADPAQWPLGRLLSAAARRVEQEWNAHLATWDLNHASLPVLVHLVRSPLSQRELAARCAITEQTMSRVLARLERTGYVQRRPDPADLRRHVISITDAGRTVVREASDPRVAEEMTVRGLTADQVRQLRALLAVVALARSGTEDAGTGGTAEPGDPGLDGTDSLSDD